MTQEAHDGVLTDTETSLLYNTLRVDGLNICITKMRPMPSLTKKPY